MPTLFTHAAVAVAAGNLVPRRPLPFYFWVVSVYCAILPDADVLAFAFGIPYEHVLGHRGLSHSFIGAAAIGALAAWRMNGRMNWGFRPLWLYFSFVTATHGLLDAVTDGGMGIAFFAPFSNTRYFLPWTPVTVSPIGAYHFFTSRGLTVMASEVKWVWLPLAVLLMGCAALRRLRPNARP
ncbi:metal-dependent hydrolase [bacterium]|nr:MAG: metal-dependent hydrolase [bacterium]